MSSGPGSAYEKLSPETAAKVDAACDGFEKAWKAARGGVATKFGFVGGTDGKGGGGLDGPAGVHARGLRGFSIKVAVRIPIRASCPIRRQVGIERHSIHAHHAPIHHHLTAHHHSHPALSMNLQ